MLHKEKKTLKKLAGFFSLLNSALKWCSERKDCLSDRTSTKPMAESQIPALLSLLLPHEILSLAEAVGRQSQVIEFLMLNQLLFISWNIEAKMSIFHVHRDRKKSVLFHYLLGAHQRAIKAAQLSLTRLWKHIRSLKLSTPAMIP